MHHGGMAHFLPLIESKVRPESVNRTTNRFVGMHPWQKHRSSSLTMKSAW